MEIEMDLYGGPSTRRLATLSCVAALLVAGFAVATEADAPPGVAIGDRLPETRVELAKGGRWIDLDQLRGDAGELIVFVSRDCPAADAWHSELDRLIRLYRTEGVTTVTLVSGKGDGPWPELDTALVFDADGALARRFGVSELPEVLLLDGGGRLVYRGAVGLRAPDDGTVIRSYLADALAAMIAREPAPTPVTRARGCALP